MSQLHRSYLFNIIIVSITFFLIQNLSAKDFFNEDVVFDFDGREWNAAFANSDKESKRVEYLLKGASIENWSELVTVIYYPIASASQSFNFLESTYHNKIISKIPSFTWSELYRDDNKAIKEFALENPTGPNKTEYTLCLLLKGKKGFHNVLYASHDKSEFLKRKQKWIDSFKNVKLFIPDESVKNFNTPLLNNPEKMIFIKYRYSVPNSTADPSILKSKKLWRATNKYFRTEEQKDSANEKHLLYIVHEPDVWMVNQFSNQGQHIIDPGPTFNTKVPAFGENIDNGLLDFELGQEQSYFKHYGARQLNDEVIDTHDCNVFELTRLYWVLKLYVRKDTNLPYLISRKAPDNSMKLIYYEDYQINLDFDSTLFMKPEGIRF